MLAWLVARLVVSGSGILGLAISFRDLGMWRRRFWGRRRFRSGGGRLRYAAGYRPARLVLVVVVVGGGGRFVPSCIVSPDGSRTIAGGALGGRLGDLFRAWGQL